MRIQKMALIGSALALAAFAPHNSSAPQRWALIVGVSDYRNFGPEIGGDLPGARWDALRMRDVLVARRGFSADRVKLVLDTAATKARIRKELTEWLPSVVKEGDEVIFFFAGHGSQEWDTNGDEADGLDETICPTDVVKGQTANDINDDEIRAWLETIPTSGLKVFLDNCHAGSGTRAAMPFARPRSLARAVSVDVPKPANATGEKAGAPAGGAAIEGQRWDEFAAAQADEVAVDAEWPGANGAPSTFGGAFTTSFVKNLWQASRRTSYQDVFAATVEDMKRERFAQRPIYTPNANPGSMSPEAGDMDDAFIPVVSVTGTSVKLGGGAAAGITAGSVFKAGTSMLRVTSVAGDAATATVVSGGAPMAGAPARLNAYAYPPAELRVSVANVDAATRAAIDAAVRGTGGLTIVTQPRDFAHLAILPSENGYKVVGMDGATRHELKGGRAQAATQLSTILRNEAGANMLASLDNPGQSKPLNFAFEGGQTEFRIGRPIAFSVTSPMDGYLTIVDLGTDGKVVLLYPEESGTNRVKAGQVVRMPPSDHFEATAPSGRGLVRAFVTQKPLDLKFKENVAQDAAAVVAALRAAAGGTAGTSALPVATWSTASLVYTIRP